MKSVISLILVFVLGLSLCACGSTSNSNGKYVGTYIDSSCSYTSMWETERMHFNSILTLNPDGTGTYKEITTNDCAHIKKETEIASGIVRWEIADGYLLVKYSGNIYFEADGNHYYRISEAKSENKSWTFELKGNLLVDIKTGKATFEKN